MDYHGTYKSRNLARNMILQTSIIMFQPKTSSLGIHTDRWWQLKYVLFSSQSPGKWNPIWRAYFSNGLVQPPTRYFKEKTCQSDTNSNMLGIAVRSHGFGKNLQWWFFALDGKVCGNAKWCIHAAGKRHIGGACCKITVKHTASLYWIISSLESHSALIR